MTGDVARRARDFARLLPVMLLDAAVIIGAWAAALALRFDGDVPYESWHLFFSRRPLHRRRLHHRNDLLSHLPHVVEVRRHRRRDQPCTRNRPRLRRPLRHQHLPPAAPHPAHRELHRARADAHRHGRDQVLAAPLGGAQPLGRLRRRRQERAHRRRRPHRPAHRARVPAEPHSGNTARSASSTTTGACAACASTPSPFSATASTSRRSARGSASISSRSPSPPPAAPPCGRSSASSRPPACRCAPCPASATSCGAKPRSPACAKSPSMTSWAASRSTSMPSSAPRRSAASRVLITGAAGYIASELARQVLAFGPDRLHLVDVNETGLYDLQRDLDADELDPEGSSSPLRIWLCDVSDAAQVRAVFSRARPDVVFHAAAYKHIPVMEEHPDAALRANVLGTLNVCAAANESGAKKMVFVSTDKAVTPTTSMAPRSASASCWSTAFGRGSRTTYTAVRFGNVMGSRGSVVPLFLRQIERGGPVLMTDPRDHALLHVGGRGGEPRDPGGVVRRSGPGLHPRHGREGAHRRPRREDGAPQGPGARPRHPDRRTPASVLAKRCTKSWSACPRSC